MEPAVVFAIGVLFVAGLVFAVIYASKKSKTVSPAKLAQLQAEAKEFIDKVVATGKITVPDGIPVVLGTDETALLHEPVQLEWHVGAARLRQITDTTKTTNNNTEIIR